MKTFDFRGLKCPIPVLKAYKIIKNEKKEVNFKFLTDDISAPKDFKDFCINTGHTLIEVKNKRNYNEINIAKFNSEK